MACSCRAGPWKAFIRGLAQVHKLESPSAPALLRVQPHGTRTNLYQRHVADSQRIRRLHASPWRQDAATAPNPETSESRGVASADQSSSSESSTTPNATPEPQEEKPKKPRSRARKQSSDDEAASTPKSGARRVKSSTKENVKERRRRVELTVNVEDDNSKPRKLDWQVQKAALKEKFPEGWKPQKRLSPDALAGIRALNAQFPETYTTKALADKFEVSPEAIRRILRSKWQPSADEEESRQQRWFKRGIQVWERKAALGIKPPKKWRQEGVVRDPSYHESSKRAVEREKKWEEEEVRKYRAQRASQQRSSTGDKPI